VKTPTPRRSSSSRTSATISTGNVVSAISVVTTIDQQKTGRRSIVIPGARRRTTVARTQADCTSIPPTASTTPSSQRSLPIPGELVESESGGNAVQPKRAAPSCVRNPEYIATAPLP
jgi:hypothetical protein